MSQSPAEYATTIHDLTKEAAQSVDGLAVLTSAIDYLKTREEEKTKRAYIWAHRDTLVTAIKERRDLIEHYIDASFSERKEVLRQHYQVLHRSLDARNNDAIQGALTGILGILEKDPLENLHQFEKAFADPNFGIEL